jgi:iron complex transport system substrate-binding protein
VQLCHDRLVSPAPELKRIVSLQPSATVILHALGKLDRVVACTKYCVDVCPDAAGSGRVVVTDSWNAQAGEILSARPDLVIASVPFQEKSLAEILKAGSRFLGFAPRTLDDIYLDIAAIAGIMNAAEAGAALVSEIQSQILEVSAKVPNSRRPRVFCEEWGKPILASQPWVAELVELAGGEFLGRPAARYQPEEIAALDPEVLIAAWCGAGNRVPLDKIISSRNWQHLSAARSGRVFCIPDEYLNTPAPTLIRGLRALAAIIHPEIFPQQQGVRCIYDKLSTPMIEEHSCPPKPASPKY